MQTDIRYLDPILEIMAAHWPNNRSVNVVCHGHSVPAGYFATPYVNTFGSYPHLLHRIIKERYPFAVVNVIVTAIGGETSVEGERRFDRDVLNHNPDLVTIDYSLNDRRREPEAVKAAWSAMIERALARGVKVILLTPSWDNSYYAYNENWKALEDRAKLVCRLAETYGVGLADTFERFGDYIRRGGNLQALLSHVNHPSEEGHAIIADEIAKYFPAR